MKKYFLLKNTNKGVVNNYPIILENTNQLIEYLENCSNSDTHIIVYGKPTKTNIYYNINGDLIYGDFSPVNKKG